MKRENLNELIRLIKEFPGLPVVPAVSDDVIPDQEGRRWLGSFGSASVQEYWVGADRIYFRDDEDEAEIEEAVNDPACVWLHEELTDEQALEQYQALPWSKVIVVNIDLPEMEEGSV